MRCLWGLAVVAISAGLAVAQDQQPQQKVPLQPGVAESQALMMKYAKDHSSVSLKATIVSLRNDVDSRTKVGKKVELVLVNDASFDDGVTLRKGTVLEGVVSDAENKSKTTAVSKLVLDWTDAQLSKKETLPLAVLVRDAKGAAGYAQTDRSFGINQIGGTANSPVAGDKMRTFETNLVLLNKKAGMPELSPGVQMIEGPGHSLSAASEQGDMVIHEGTQLVVVLIKDRAAVK